MADWYETWFNTPYYHLLYQYRDQFEANQFIYRIIQNSGLHPGQHILDNACGAGRHSIELHAAGLDVTGCDLSENSIQQAKRNESPRLKFFVWDMRKPFRRGYFNAVFNLFTSFGYFDSSEEDLHIMQAAYDNLIPGGMFLLDFLNAEIIYKEIGNEIQNLHKTIENIDFNIKKYIESNRVIKEILVSEENQHYTFCEKVSLYNRQQLTDMAHQSGFEVEKIYGDYNLNPFNSESPRCIFVMRKKQ